MPKRRADKKGAGVPALLVALASGTAPKSSRGQYMVKSASRRVYQIKITLEGAKPPIWRRLLVPSSLTLGALHDILQISMGWTDSHLHQFVAGGTFYGVPDPEYGGDRIDE